LGTLATPVTNMQRKALTGDRVHGHPEPLLVGLLFHETPPRIGFGFPLAQDDVRWTFRQLDVQVIRTGRNALHPKAQQPGEADAHGTADPTQRDALTQQVFHHSAPLIRTEAVFGRSTKLACARCTLMILFPMAGMAIFLIPA
jgi:hypothetical protein